MCIFICQTASLMTHIDNERYAVPFLFEFLYSTRCQKYKFSIASFTD